MNGIEKGSPANGDTSMLHIAVIGSIPINAHADKKAPAFLIKTDSEKTSRRKE